MRLTDQEYTDLYATLTNAESLDLTALAAFHKECDCRGLEAILGMRSGQSVKAGALVKLVKDLEQKFECRLVYHNSSYSYTQHAANYSPYAWAK